jgi:hypothetical protein
MSICPDNQGRRRRPSVIGLGPARAKTDFKITYPGFGAAIHALNGRARIWLDECADGIPVGDGDGGDRLLAVFDRGGP